MNSENILYSNLNLIVLDALKEPSKKSDKIPAPEYDLKQVKILFPFII